MLHTSQDTFQPITGLISYTIDSIYLPKVYTIYGYTHRCDRSLASHFPLLQKWVWPARLGTKL